MSVKEVQIKELKAAVQEAKSSSSKDKDDLMAMTAHQEQSRAILESLRSKLSEQVTDGRKEIEKLIEEKRLAES